MKFPEPGWALGDGSIDDETPFVPKDWQMHRLQGLDYFSLVLKVNPGPPHLQAAARAV